MRAIAACQFTLSRFEVWRGAVAAFTVCVVLALLMWFSGQPEMPHWSLAFALGLVVLAAIGLGASLLRTRALSLRWDGLDWHLGPAAAVGQEPLPSSQAGTLSVSLDLGNWMLLRFRPDPPHGRFGPVWVPVQRRGLEPHWHSLRCAVYSPRPARDAAHNANAVAEF